MNFTQGENLQIHAREYASFVRFWPKSGLTVVGFVVSFLLQCGIYQYPVLPIGNRRFVPYRTILEPSITLSQIKIGFNQD